jgi:hypothetical protein
MLALLFSATFATPACGGGEAKTPDDVVATDEPSLADVEEELADDDELTFDEEAAKVVLERSRRKAANCSSVAPDTPQTTGDVYVTFDGPKGRAVEVKLSVDFQVGSDQGQRCIKNAFIGEIIPPFKGSKTVTYRLDLSPKE